MFAALTVIVISATFGAAVVPDDELIRTLNTFLNFLTVAMLLWNQNRLKTRIEPKVDRVVKSVESQNDWDGSERREDN